MKIEDVEGWHTVYASQTGLVSQAIYKDELVQAYRVIASGKTQFFVGPDAWVRVNIAYYDAGGPLGIINGHAQ